MMHKGNFLLLILFLLFLKPLCAQNNDSNATAVTEFNLAMNLYDANQYQDAIKLFDRVINAPSITTRTTAALLFKSKSLVKLNKYDEALSTLNNFKDEYSQSKYIDEVRIDIANIYFNKQEYLNAFKELTNEIDSTSNDGYRDYSRTTAKQIALDNLTSGQVKEIEQNTFGENLRPFLLYVESLVLSKEGKQIEADVVQKRIKTEYPNSPEAHPDQMFSLTNISQTDSSSTPLIGVLLPVKQMQKGDASDAGYEILEGIKFAVAKYNNTHENKIGLLIRNTERKKEKIKEIEKEFELVPQIKCVIGPLYSDEVRTTLEAFKSTGIPIISPTATENSLTDLYPNFFQANPSFAVRGKIMAQYIYYVENKRKIAVLNAIDGYSPLLANAFSEEFQKLGGTVVVQTNYHSNSFDLSKPVSMIAADSLQIQGVYLPLADSRDVPALLSQFVQHNLNVKIYGNQDWFQAKGYETSPELSNKLTFSSDYYIDYKDTAFQNFSKDFVNQTGLDANRNVLYGYDIANYFLSTVSNLNADRNGIIKQLEADSIFKGYHNNFYFDNQRVNKFMNIVRYKDGKFELIDKFKAGS